MIIDTRLSDSLASVDILRHGLIDGYCVAAPRFIGSIDDALSAQGWQQMHAAVQNNGYEWDLIVSSPLRRCCEFAEVLATERKIPLQLMHGLREYHFGVWEGEYLSDIAARDPLALQNFWNDPMAHTPIAAESLEEFRLRVVAVWQTLLQYQDYRRILVISHGGVMRLLNCHLNQYSMDNFMSYRPDFGEMLRVRNQKQATNNPAGHVAEIERVDTCVR